MRGAGAVLGVVLVLFGLAVILLGLTGRLGSFLAALTAPQLLVPSTPSIPSTGASTVTLSPLTGLPQPPGGNVYSNAWGLTQALGH